LRFYCRPECDRGENRGITGVLSFRTRLDDGGAGAKNPLVRHAFSTNQALALGTTLKLDIYTLQYCREYRDLICIVSLFLSILEALIVFFYISKPESLASLIKSSRTPYLEHSQRKQRFYAHHLSCISTINHNILSFNCLSFL